MLYLYDDNKLWTTKQANKQIFMSFLFRTPDDDILCDMNSF